MILEIRKLNAQQKYFGTIETEYSAPKSLIEIPFVEFVAPVRVRFEYEIFQDDSVEVKGKVSYKLKGQCSHCLKEAETEIVGDLDAYFQPVKDCEDYSYANGVVDLKQAVEDAIMASMPFTLSCGENCKSLEYFDEPSK